MVLWGNSIDISHCQPKRCPILSYTQEHRHIITRQLLRCKQYPYPLRYNSHKFYSHVRNFGKQLFLWFCAVIVFSATFKIRYCVIGASTVNYISDRNVIKWFIVMIMKQLIMLSAHLKIEIENIEPSKFCEHWAGPLDRKRLDTHQASTHRKPATWSITCTDTKPSVCSPALNLLIPIKKQVILHPSSCGR